MKAVILAAGRGTGLRPITDTIPKTMITLGNKPLLEHILNSLPYKIDEIIVVVNYLDNKIKNYFGKEFAGHFIRYVKQKNLFGTYDSLLSAKKFLKNGPFLVLLGDNIYNKIDLANLVEYETALAVLEVDNRSHSFGTVVVNNGYIKSIKRNTAGLNKTNIFTGACVLTSDIFNIDPIKNFEKEKSLPHTIVKLSKNKPVSVFYATKWQPVGQPEELEKARKNFNKIIF